MFGWKINEQVLNFFTPKPIILIQKYTIFQKETNQIYVKSCPPVNKTKTP